MNKYLNEICKPVWKELYTKKQYETLCWFWELEP
jgi:hypothetical protein